MSAAQSEAVLAAMGRECGRCDFHGIPCPDHAQERIEGDAQRIAQLEHQVATLTVAPSMAQKGGAE